MTIAFDKSCNASAAVFGGASGTSFPSGPTWSGSTSASATYAIMVLGFSANPGTITATGWTARTTFNNGSNCYVVTFEIVGSGAAGRSGTESISWTNSVNVACAVLATYTGTATSSPHDVSDSTATGTSSSPAGGAVTPTVSTDLVLGAVNQASQSTSATATFSSPLPSGATVRVEKHQGGGSGHNGSVNVGLIEYLPGGTSTYTPSLSSTSSLAWAGITSAILAPAAVDDYGWMFHRGIVYETVYEEIRLSS